jgi:hypothetical protein
MRWRRLTRVLEVAHLFVAVGVLGYRLGQRRGYDARDAD